MIVINLLPEEFKVVEKKSSKPQLILGGLGLALLLIVATLFLYADFLLASAKLSGLEKDWLNKQPHFQKLTVLRNEVEGGLAQEKSFMERFVTTDKPLTYMMNWIGDHLPETTWLTEVSLTRDETVGNLRVKGLALPGKETSSIEQIEDYMQELKQKMPDAHLSLTTSRQDFEDVKVTQFVANFKWGSGKANG